MFVPTCLLAQEQASPQTKSKVEMARGICWFDYEYMKSRLSKLDSNEYPGIQAWLDEYQKFAQNATANDPSTWPNKFDFDKVVLGSPTFWQATFEVVPGDAAWMSSYVSKLIGAGEFERARTAIIILLHSDHFHDDIRKTMLMTLSLSELARTEVNELVEEGVKHFDQGKLDAAMENINQALELNPASGFAWYEYAFTKRRMEIEKDANPSVNAMFKFNSEGKLEGELPRYYNPDIRSALEKSRQHNPLFPSAYFLDDKDLLERSWRIQVKLTPLWNDFSKDGPMGRISDEKLQEFATMCQQDQLHEAAILARIVLAERRKSYSKEDVDFLAISLRAIAPGEPVETALKRLGQADPKLRMLIPQKP